MKQFINRQPFLLLKDNGYVEKELVKYANSFCYELILAEKIMMLPNNCLDYIWNMDRKELYCFENITEHRELEVIGDRLFGIHLDSLYICKCDIKSVELWMEQLANCHGFEERFTCCNNQIDTILHVEQVHPFMRHAIRQMEEAKGKVTIETIATELNYTPRHMERLFLQTFSCGPKRFCRYVRLLNAIYSMMQFPNRNIAYHIENLGYSDQTHFQREFKMFIGMTPKQFLKQYVEERSLF